MLPVQIASTLPGSTAPRRVPADRWSLGLLATAMFFVFLLPGVVGSYGLFIDELYYVACSKRLDLGYVDHPPLAPALLAVSRAVFGDVALALRVPPALAGALTVFLTGFVASRLGAGRWGQLVAALAAAVAPVYHVLFGIYSMNCLEILLWVVGAWILVEMALRDAPRLWLAFGLVAGVGLENKHTMVLFGFAVAVGVLLTPLRRHLRTPWPWVGLALSALLLLPNVAWQVSHDWPTLEFYRNADLNKNVATPPHLVLLFQILFMSPGTLPLWVAGAVWLLFDRDGRRWRHLGWAFVVLLALMVLGQKSPPDRIAGIYPVAFAAARGGRCRGASPRGSSPGASRSRRSGCRSCRRRSSRATSPRRASCPRSRRERARSPSCRSGWRIVSAGCSWLPKLARRWRDCHPRSGPRRWCLRRATGRPERSSCTASNTACHPYTRPGDRLFKLWILLQGPISGIGPWPRTPSLFDRSVEEK